ncbi:S9 family peptidase [Aequorivita viscosa]|uniref:Dipeptidyl aminopeptidase/acylaminoacyl peptidase n=1 Tax=Aequorivita viscosa TaxID=797419 RepID=A0A1M6LZK6_9FLAO|nr:prolyl oligopeptidase family serine peptidase [Aequorivita viscosa]SDX32119.1 Dipeptidyl aminopeptidase/acylaminoacyl peptidase [Aequorivita viscosa]SHJ76582.1 Dipeptidyl aminopeptidase/acylaminoacyl peptidase [Aequorivita viscosa]
MKFSLTNSKINVAISQFLLLCLFVMASCPLVGQSEPSKPVVQPKDYSMWHTLRFPQISGDGKWSSYLLDYEQAMDTLFVIDINGKIIYELPNANNGQFEPSEKPKLFAFKHNAKGIGVLNMSSGITEYVSQADRFEFSSDGKFLAVFNLQKQNGYLKLFDVEKNKTTIIQNVQNFNFDPTGSTALLVINKAKKVQVELIRLHNMQQSIILSSENSNVLYPTWHENGKTLVFLVSSNDSKQRLYFFKDGETPVLKELDDIDLKELGDVEISKLDLSFSKDGERIFFWNHMRQQISDKNDADSVKVQVWKGTDKWIYPRQKLDWEYNKIDKMAVWWPLDKKVSQIGTNKQPEVILTGDQKFAISYNILTYEPQNLEFPQSDFYITNLETGEYKLLVEKLDTAVGYLSIEPSGRYLAYFKENSWWIYDIKNNIHRNASVGIPFPLNYKHPPHSVDVIPYGYMKWTRDKELLVYDEFDIWKINPDGSSPQILTNGRSSSISYRAYNFLYDGFYNTRALGINSTYKTVEDDVFITRDSLFNYGFAIQNSNGTITPIQKNTGKISDLRKAKYANSYVFIKEKNNEPPALYSKVGNRIKMLVQSNKQHYKFRVGKTELISYKNKQGEHLHGLLHYPDNYEQGKKYPMVVRIYELLSHHYQSYINPSLQNADGFNYKNFTAAGYFVLQPDILIQKGEPGISATDCVITAVNNVLEKDVVDKKGIGLIGHSFGGYETAFIISQTNLFAAAVVGTGVFDIVDFYHTVGKNSGRPDHWRFESQQWRIGKSFYEDKKVYKNNSPLEYAHKINTPTLIWTGNKDYHVNWHQSEAMFLSLRRQKIDVEMLIYENEEHALLQSENQLHLTNYIQKWFDRHLKNE